MIIQSLLEVMGLVFIFCFVYNCPQSTPGLSDFKKKQGTGWKLKRILEKQHLPNSSPVVPAPILKCSQTVFVYYVAGLTSN